LNKKFLSEDLLYRNKKFPSEDPARVKQSVKGLDFDCNKVRI